MDIYYYMLYVSIKIYGQPTPGADPENFSRGGGPIHHPENLISKKKKEKWIKAEGEGEAQVWVSVSYLFDMAF